MAVASWTRCWRRSKSAACKAIIADSFPAFVQVSAKPPQLLQRPISYAARLKARQLDAIDLAVIHCTELPDLETAREYGERIHHSRSRTGNCGHYYVDRDGSVQQWVPLERTAHHVRGYNGRSLGIELVNRGRFPDWLHSRRQTMEEPYPQTQVTALIRLLRHLRSVLPGLRWIAGHEDLDTGRVPATDNPAVQVFRKRDPGPRFPWQTVLDEAGLARFPELTELD